MFSELFLKRVHAKTILFYYYTWTYLIIPSESTTLWEGLTAGAWNHHKGGQSQHQEDAQLILKEVLSNQFVGRVLSCSTKQVRTSFHSPSKKKKPFLSKRRSVNIWFLSPHCKPLLQPSSTLCTSWDLSRALKSSKTMKTRSSQNTTVNSLWLPTMLQHWNCWRRGNYVKLS